MGDIARSASVRVEKIALYGEKQDTPSTPGNGGSDQSRTSVRLAWRDWSGTNEALSIYACDATVNRLIIDTVGDGIRQQYRAVWIFFQKHVKTARRTLTIVRGFGISLLGADSSH